MSNESFIDLIKYFIPLIAFLGLTYLFLEHWKKQEMARFKMQMNREYKSLILPTRVQAYERMVLFLERISPNNLVTRLNDSSFTANEFKYVLTKEISDEFEHNLSQQLYISSNTWRMITLAKDQTIQLILQTSSSLSADAKSKDLAIAILNQTISDKKNMPTSEAIELLKTDFFDLMAGR
jgi:hypothetical protein